MCLPRFWRIPGTGELVGLPSMGSHRVGHDRSDLAAAAAAGSIYSASINNLPPKQPSWEAGGLLLLLCHLCFSINLNVSSWETQKGHVLLSTLWAGLKAGHWKLHLMVTGDTDSPTHMSKPCLTLHLYPPGCHDAISASLFLPLPSVQNAKCPVPYLFK